MYSAARRASFRELQLLPGDSVLIAGIGTGLDLPHIPAGVTIVGVDANPWMLQRARNVRRNPTIGLVLGDAQSLPCANARFDAIVLHLILSVAADPTAVFREAVRVARPGGKIAVIEQFAPETGIGWARRGLNRLARLGGTDITRRLPTIIAGQPVEVRNEVPALLCTYRVITMQRTETDAAAICRSAYWQWPTRKRWRSQGATDGAFEEFFDRPTAHARAGGAR